MAKAVKDIGEIKIGSYLDDVHKPSRSHNGAKTAENLKKIAGITNWGRWGKNDERGTLNYLTPEVIVQAARLIKKGKVYSLAIPIERGAPDNNAVRNPLWHLNMVTQHKGHGTEISNRGSADDVIIMHTQSTTHVDGLASYWYGGELYNGFSPDVIDRFGTRRCAVAEMKAIVGRGILLDMARFLKKDPMPLDYVITPKDIEACAKAEGVEFRSGDILLFRTGWLKNYFYGTGTKAYYKGHPGTGVDCVRWLHDHEIVAVGADTVGVEKVPSEDPQVYLPLHAIYIRDMGGYIMEYFDLDGLAKDRAYEFFFLAAPLKLKLGLNSPLHPIAIT